MKHASPIWALIVRRLLLGALTLLGISVIVFVGIQMLPGDVATELLGQSATPETVAAIRRSLGLDVPAYVRYFWWLGRLLTGDFGTAMASGRAISELLWPRLINTSFLALITSLISVPVAVVCGLLGAVYRGTFVDRLFNIVTLAAISLPEFLMAYLLILWLAVDAGIFPSLSQMEAGQGFLSRVYVTALPALTLTFGVLAHMTRMTRASLINLLENQYIETARLKGLSEWRVLARHGLPNAVAPIVNVIALNLAYLVTGVVVVETIFVYPGLGQLMVDSVQLRDIPVVQTCTLVFASAYIILNLLADVVSVLANPRLLHPR